MIVKNDKRIQSLKLDYSNSFRWRHVLSGALSGRATQLSDEQASVTKSQSAILVSLSPMPFSYPSLAATL